MQSVKCKNVLSKLYVPQRCVYIWIITEALSDHTASKLVDI